MRISFGKSPLIAWLMVLVGILLAGIAIALSIFFFTLFALFFIVAVGVLAIRLWWFRRHLRRSGKPSPGPRSPDVIEGEYVVVEQEKKP